MTLDDLSGLIRLRFGPNKNISETTIKEVLEFLSEMIQNEPKVLELLYKSKT